MMVWFALLWLGLGLILSISPIDYYQIKCIMYLYFVCVKNMYTNSKKVKRKCNQMNIILKRCRQARSFPVRKTRSCYACDPINSNNYLLQNSSIFYNQTKNNLMTVYYGSLPLLYSTSGLICQRFGRY